jgi:hypothetical protein
MFFDKETIGNTDVYAALNSFFNTVQKFLDPNNSEYRSWASEFETMNKFLKSIPKDYHEETLNRLVNIFIEKVNGQPNKNAYTNELFFKTLNLNFFADYLPMVAQNVKREDQVFNMIKNLISEGNIDTTIKVTEHFLLPESRHLKNVSASLTQILQNNNRNLIYYFLDNYEGWDTRPIVDLIFKYGNLDDVFLEKYFQKIESISDLDTLNIAVNNLLQRNFPANRKLDILEKLLNEEHYPDNNNLINFYLNNIYNGEFTIEKLKARDSHFFKLFNNVDYISKWANQDNSGFNKAINFIVDNQLVSSEVWAQVVPALTSKNVHNNSVFISWLKLGNLMQEDCNTVAYQRLLACSLFNYFVAAIDLYAEVKDKLDTTISIDYQDKQFSGKTLGEVLQKNKVFSWNIEQLQHTPVKLQNALAVKILQEVGDASYLESNINTTLNTPAFNQFVKALQGNMEFQDFFQTYFIDYPFKNSPNQFRILTQILKTIKEQSFSLVFDLPENNPLQQLIDKNNIKDNKSYWRRYDSDAHEQYMSALIKVLGIPCLSAPSSQNTNLVAFFKEEKLVPWNESEELSNKCDTYLKSIGKGNKSIWKSWFSSSPVAVQIVVENNQSRLIFNPTEKITRALEKINQISSPNSIDDLLNQSQISLSQLHDMLSANSDKDLLLDVKINAENILLENINFLEEIREVAPDINIENMNFLKSNLGKYLLESMNSYVRTITRYEVMLNSNNNGKTSFDIDLQEMKNKSDQEELRQLGILAKQFQVVKQSIVSQLSEDALRDMRVRTRILEEHLDNTISQNQPTDGNVISITPAKKM